MRSDAEQALAQQVNKLENDKQQLQQHILMQEHNCKNCSSLT
jgi:hypothetical protein